MLPRVSLFFLLLFRARDLFNIFWRLTFNFCSFDDSDKPEKSNPFVALAGSLEAALSLIKSHQESLSPRVERVFLIGGSQLYTEGVRSTHCQNIILTRIQTTVECDTFFPDIQGSEYTLLPSAKSHEFLETFLNEPVEGGMITEGDYKYEYTVYTRV